MSTGKRLIASLLSSILLLNVLMSDSISSWAELYSTDKGIQSPISQEHLMDHVATGSNAAPNNGELGENQYFAVQDVNVSTPSSADAFFSYSIVIDEFKISIQADRKVFPEDPEVVIEKIAVINGIPVDEIIMEQLAVDEILNQAVAFNITFYINGLEVQPENGSVDVSIELLQKDDLNSISNLSDARVFHIDDNCNVEEVDCTFAEDRVIKYDVSKFSVYGVALISQEFIPIYTAQDLQNIQNDTSASYRLMNDIDLNGFDWKMIDCQYNEKGCLDGNHHSIRNLTINETTDTSEGWFEESSSAGLFSRLNMDVKDLWLENVNITIDGIPDPHPGESTGFFGTLAAQVNSYSTDYSVVELNNIHVIGAKLNIIREPGSCVHNYIGGLVGGGRYSNLNIASCSFMGEITYSSSNAWDEYYGYFAWGDVGGIIGEAGTLTGYMDNINQCFNQGNIVLYDITDYDIGGIAGYSSHLQIEDSYNIGCLSVNGNMADVVNDNRFTGGIIGYGYDVSVQNVYNIGEICTDFQGGECNNGEIIGSASEEVVLRNAYYLNEGYSAVGKGSGQSYNANGLTEAELLKETSYAGYDFSSVWDMGIGDYPYPVLKWQDIEPNDPGISDIPEENIISQLGWVKLDDGELAYYRNGERLKDGAYYLHCFDEKGNIYEGYWRFDSEGIVQTGLIDGKYYYASNDGKYPYGMSIPLEDAEDVIAKSKPYIMLGNYDFIETTLMDSLNLWDYFILGSPDEGLKTLIGSVLQNYLQSNAKGLLPERLFGNLSFRASIRLKYMQDVGKNKKVLKDLLETKLKNDLDLLSENKTFKVVKNKAEDVTGYFAEDFEKLLKEKREAYNKNPDGKWSDSYKEMMKALDENDETSYLAYVVEQNIKFYTALLEKSDEWEKANYDYSSCIDFLDNIIEVASRLNEKGTIEGGNALISAATELKSNYENIWRITIANQIFDCIEMSDGWSEVITGKSEGDIVTWDFNENAVVNGIDILSELTKKGIKELLPSFDIASKLVSELQKIDGRAAVLESLAEMQDINEIAYDILKAETDIIESGNAQPQDYVDYFSTFNFMRLVVLARYNYAKDYYSATGNTEPDKKVIIEFLESEIEKLNNMTPLNYPSYAPGAYKGEWNDAEKRYYYTSGLYLKDGWKQINNETYYFDKDGRTLLGLQTITDSRGTYEYYFSTGAGNIEANKAHYGALQKGEIVLENGKEYFFAPETGRMVKNCVIEIHLGKYKYYDENGVYVPGKIYEGIAPPALPERVPFDNGIRTYKINCPVNVIVYDSSMTKVAAIIDDTAQNVESSDVFVEIDANEQKVIYTPLDKAYIIQIEAIGAGYMDYSIMEYVNQSDIRKIDYRNIPLSKGEIFLGTTEKIENTSATMHQWTYYLENNDEYEYLTEVQENLSLYTIDISVDGNGKVSGDKMTIRGDYVKLYAYPESGFKFDGWFDTAGECVSNEAEYRMRVLESIHLIAKFSPGNSGSSLGAISTGNATKSDYQRKNHIDALKASVYGGTWEKDSIGWRLRLDGNGGYARSQWAMVNGLWYLFDASGHMMTGWQLVNHIWYYLDSVNGDMKTGWIQIKKLWYYFDPLNGDMQTAWIKVDGVWYYLDPVNGDMKTGWKQIGSFWYYLNPISDGTMGSLYVNTVTPDGYKVDTDGKWIEG